MSLFQLKHSCCYRVFCKTPYYIRNMVLLLIQGLLLALIYMIFFRADGGSLEKALKILKGLNSNTFNYLSQEKV